MCANSGLSTVYFSNRCKRIKLLTKLCTKNKQFNKLLILNKKIKLFNTWISMATKDALKAYDVVLLFIIYLL